MMSDPRDYLDHVMERAEAATPGPWSHWPEADSIEITTGDHSEVICGQVRPKDGWGTPAYEGGTEPTAEFIAAARSDVPRIARALLAVLDELDKWEVPDPHDPGEGCTDCDIQRDIRHAITKALGKDDDS